MPKADALAYLGKARSLLENDQLEQSLQCYTKAVQAAPEWAQVYLERGSAYSQADDYEAAIADFDKAE